MKKRTITSLALVFGLALTSAPAADITPAETKAIAEEGFIYGLPIVMNYGIMYEYAVDKKSSQFKAPFNQLNSMHRVATPEDTAIVTPNSDTPYSLGFMDLRAEPVVISVPAIEKSRYYSVQLCDGNTFNYGYIGTRATGPEAGDYMVAGPNWKGETPPGIKKVFNSTTEFSMVIFRTQLFNPKGYAECDQDPEGVQNATALGLSKTASTDRGTGDQVPEDRQGIGQNRVL
jgi:hypothetical protein